MKRFVLCLVVTLVAATLILGSVAVAGGGGPKPTALMSLTIRQ